MLITDAGALTALTPDSLKGDPKFKAAADALGIQFAATAQAIRNVLHLPRLDELHGSLLDLLAWQFHIDCYEPLYLSDEQKRALIRQAVAWHRKRGTVAAVEELCATVFKGVEVQEWFAYGGEPFLFRLTAKAFARSEDDYRAFKRLIHVAKNVRSHLDSITIDASPDPLRLVVGLARLCGGNVTLKRDKPKDLSARLGVALNLHTSGTVLLPRKQPQFRFNVPLIVSTARSFAGRIVIKPTGYADIDDPLPADFIGSFIWFRFFAPTGKRGLKLRNARPDVTKQDLQDVADYLIDNQVLLNSKGDPLTHAVRASVVHVDEHHIIKPIQRS